MSLAEVEPELLPLPPLLELPPLELAGTEVVFGSSFLDVEGATKAAGVVVGVGVGVGVSLVDVFVVDVGLGVVDVDVDVGVDLVEDVDVDVDDVVVVEDTEVVLIAEVVLVDSEEEVVSEADSDETSEEGELPTAPATPGESDLVLKIPLRCSFATKSISRTLQFHMRGQLPHSRRPHS